MQWHSILAEHIDKNTMIWELNRSLKFLNPPMMEILSHNECEIIQDLFDKDIY